MSMEQGPEQPNDLESIRNIIAHAREKIELELKRSPKNNWSAAFNSVLAGIRMHLDFLDSQPTVLSKEKHKKIKDKLKKLIVKNQEIGKKHNGDPPEEERKKLLARLIF